MAQEMTAGPRRLPPGLSRTPGGSFDWANELADAMADSLVNEQQLQPPQGVVAGFSSEAELRAQQPPMLPYRARVQAQRQQKQQQLQQRQQEQARERQQRQQEQARERQQRQQERARERRQQRQQQSQPQARTAANELSEYELQRDANVAENKRKLDELFGTL